MYRASKVYPDTSKNAITVSATQVITTAGTAGTVYACIGETGTMSGEAKIKALAKALEGLKDRIRNVLKAATIGRVECDAQGRVVSYTTDVGLTNDAFVSCGYKLSDADMAQATGFISVAIEAIIEELAERVQTGQFSFNA
jgi:hypothetical protein